jgi:antitoxin YefM
MAERGLRAVVKWNFLSYNKLYSNNWTEELEMDAITYTRVRENLAKTMDKVCDDHSPVIITRKNQRSVVIMSLEDYRALEETAYLLRSPKNARRLLESIAELEAGGGAERELVEWNSFSPSTPGKIIFTGNGPTGKSSIGSTNWSKKCSVHPSKARESLSLWDTASRGIGPDG